MRIVSQFDLAAAWPAPVALVRKRPRANLLSHDPKHAQVSTLVEALINSADSELWRRYCRLATELEGPPAVAPVHARGSMEWQAQQNQKSNQAEQALPAHAEDAGRSRILRRGAAAPFAGAPSPFGAAGSEEFDAFLAQQRGAPSLLTEIDTVERQLVAAFEAAGSSGRCHATGFRDGVRVEVTADWFGRMQLDFGRNAVILPDGPEVAGIEVTIGPAADVAHRGRERPAQAMLRQALMALWERGAFTAGTGSERVLALVLRELGLSPSDPPYGFKSAETVRKLRKALKMSL
jgi:hypothetical protein